MGKQLFDGYNFGSQRALLEMAQVLLQETQMEVWLSQAQDEERQLQAEGRENRDAHLNGKK